MSAYDNFWIRVSDVLSASLIGRLYLCIVHGIAGAFHASWFYSFFTKADMRERAENSKIFSSVRKVLFGGRFAEFVSQSALMRFLCYLPDYLLSAKMPVLSFYFIPAGALLFVRYFGNIPAMVGFAAVIVMGLELLGARSTVGEVIFGSGIAGGLMKFFFIRHDESKKARFSVCAVFAALAGFTSGGASFFLGNTMSVILFAGLLFLQFLTASPMLLIFLTLFSGIALSTLPASLLAALTLVVVLCRLYLGLERLPKQRVVYVLTLLLAFLTLFYTFFGYGGSDGVLAGSIHFVMMMFFFAVTVVVNSRDKLKNLLFAISLSTVYTGLYGVYQRLTGQGGTGWSYTNEYVGGLKRISATFLNPNVYGEFIIFAIFLIVAAFLTNKGFFKRLILFGCFGLQVVNLGLTYSRGCFIAVAFAMMIVVWCCDKRILSVGIFALPAAPYVLPRNIITRILSVGDYLKDGSVLYRFSIWKSSLRVIKNHWFVGSGVGTVAFTAFYQNYMIGGVTAQHAHNVFMQISIELSILALVLMLLIIVTSVRDVSHTVKTYPGLENKFVIIPFIAAFSAIFIEGLVDYIFYNNIVFLFFWTVLALLVCGLNIVDDRPRVTGKE